jgi:hypothetical protein
MNKKIVALSILSALLVSSAVYAQNYTGYSGKGLTILAPKIIGFVDEDDSLATMVQSEFVSNFTSYSTMSVLNFEELGELYHKLLSSGYYDDNAEALQDLAHLIPTEYMMSGSITQRSTGYVLQMSITNTRTGDKTTAASYSGICTIEELDNLLGIRRASLDLLQKMGIPLDDKARRELNQAADQKAIAMAKMWAGLIALQRSGATEIEVLDYLFRMSVYDDSLLEIFKWIDDATNRLKSMVKPLEPMAPTDNIRDQALREIAIYRIEQENKRIDEENKQIWIKTLTDCEQYFVDFFKKTEAFYELVYSSDIKRIGEIDPVRETLTLGFDATTYTSLDTPAFKAARQTVQAVLAGLNGTGRKEAWGLANWPRSTVTASPFTNQKRAIKVVVELLNEHKQIIGSTDISLTVGWDCEVPPGELPQIWPITPQAITVRFDNLSINNIPDKIFIHFARINGVDVETENDLLKRTPRSSYHDASGGGYGWEGFNKEGRDREGYGRDGFNSAGYDRGGYGRDGYDRYGYGRDGFNIAGYGRDGFNRRGYDRESYDRDGYGRDGFNKEKYHRNGTLYDNAGYDWTGFDREGYDREGYGSDGFNKEGYNTGGYGRDGFNKEGYDREGYNRSGWKYVTYSYPIWFGIGAYFDTHYIDIFDQSSELAFEPPPPPENYPDKWLHGGKFGMDFGISWFTIGAYLATASYKADYINKSNASDYGTVSGFGVGGDFSVGASISNIMFGDGPPPIGGTLRAGITLLYFPDNPLNVPAVIPYFQLSCILSALSGGLKLELPVINGIVSPRFGLVFGGAWAWLAKTNINIRGKYYKGSGGWQ